MEAINIIEKINEKILSERRTYAPRCNYASSAGHPCARKLVYDRLDWQQKALPSPKAIKRMDVGRRIEDYTIDLIKNAGVPVVEQQRPLEWPELQLSGRIEGQIKPNGELVLFEVKSVKAFDFEDINSAEDLLNSRKWWIRGYYDQFQLYLFLLNRERGLFFISSLEGEIKQFEVSIDYEYAEKIAKKLELVNKHVAAKTYPDRITDKRVCSMCDFRQVCLPDEVSDAITITDNPELLQLLERREAVKKAASEYARLDKSVKETYLKGKPAGDYLVNGKFQVCITDTQRKTVPDEIKKKYEILKPSQRIEIDALEGV